MAAALAEVTSAFEATAAAPCVDYVVTARSPAETLTGLGPKQPDRPDGWVSDSPRWVDRAVAAGAKVKPAAPFAVSPVVVAMDPSRAKQLSKAPGWSDLLGASGPLRLSDPRSTTAGLLALTAVLPSLGGPEGRTAIQQLAKTASPSTEDLFQAYEADPAKAPAFPVSEADLIAHNSAKPDRPMALVAPAGSPPPFEYALVSVSTDAERLAALDELRRYLRGADAAATLADHGLRPAADPAKVPTTGGDPALSPSVGAPAVGTTPTAGQVSAASDAWQAATVGFRLLVAFDVSGSMGEPVGTSTRIAITEGAASIALSALPRDTEVGLWAFSVRLGPNGADHRELAPIKSLRDEAQRKRSAAAAASLGGMVGGGTGLYDTIWAAYQHLQRDHDPHRVNAVVLLTDGYNEDPSGLTLAQLKARIAAAKDPRRPVAVTTIGIGNDVDARSLTEISRMTSSDYYAAPRPQDIGRVLAKALIDHECHNGVCV